MEEFEFESGASILAEVRIDGHEAEVSRNGKCREICVHPDFGRGGWTISEGEPQISGGRGFCGEYDMREFMKTFEKPAHVLIVQADAFVSCVQGRGAREPEKTLFSGSTEYGG